MNRAKLLRFSIRLATSLSSTRQPALHFLGPTQVNRFSQLAQSPLFFSPVNPQSCYKNFNLHQNRLFSTKPESFLDLVLSNDWSEELEIELEKSDLKLTHESVVYALVKFNKNPRKSLGFFNWACVRKGFDPSYVPYALLLRSLACKEFEKDFWVVASEMQEKGFYIDHQVHLSVFGNLQREKIGKGVEKWAAFYKTMCGMYDSDDVAKFLVNSILESDWSEEVEGKLKKKLKFPLSEGFLLRVLKDMWRQPLRALMFFDWVGSSGGYEHNSATYNEMLKVLGQAESIDEFWELFERMKSEGFDVDIDSFVKILKHLPIGDAVKLFEVMIDGPYKPSLQEGILLLRIMSQQTNPDMDLANRVVNKCVAAGFTLSKKVYDGMHRILCKIDRLDDAKKVVEEMRNAGYEPDNITYSQEIFGLCSQKRFEEACKIIDQMEAQGCVPDVKTWTILLQGYIAADQPDDALSCFLRMKEKNINPDAEMLEVMIYGFLSKDKVFGAYRFLVEMVKKGHIKPWQATFKLLIEKLAEVGNLEEALDLVSMMKKQGYPPFTDPIVQYISKSGTVEDAKKVLKAQAPDGAPSTAAYVRVIKTFVEEGRESDARELIFSCPYRVRSNKAIRNLFSSGQTTALEQKAAGGNTTVL